MLLSYWAVLSEWGLCIKTCLLELISIFHDLTLILCLVIRNFKRRKKGKEIDMKNERKDKIKKNKQ